MNLDSVKNVLDRYAGGAARSLPSVLRILLIGALSFLLLGPLFPQRTRSFEDIAFNRVAGIRDDDVAIITSGRRSDTHGFQGREDDGSFRIAWIGGSSIQSIGDSYYTFIPAEVARTVSTVDDQPVTTDIYFLSGIRAVDTYTAFLSAVADEPDMIVVTVNPVWALNNSATRGWSELDPATSQLLIEDAQSIPVLAPYLAPSDLALGAAAYASAPVRDRIRLTEDITEQFQRLSLLDRTTPNEAEPPDELDRIRGFNIPVQFWQSYRLPPIPGQSTEERQAQLLAASELEANTINRQVLDEIGRVGRETGIPTFAYVAPVNHESLADPVFDEALTAIEDVLAGHAAGWDGPNQRFDPVNLSRTVPPFAFEDLVHIQEPFVVSDHLAGELCVFLEDIGRDCQ